MASFVFALILLFTAAEARETVYVSGLEPPEGAFWLTTELISLSLTPNCLASSFCFSPSFKITQTMKSLPESTSMNWPIDDQLLKEKNTRSFVTYWTNGEPKMVAFIAEVFGKDPSFGFARVCDQSPEVKIFQPENPFFMASSATRARRHLGDERKPAQALEAPIEVSLIGKCFNATFAIRRHVQRCPWCPDRDVHVSLNGVDSSENEESAALLLGDDRVFYSLIILCASAFIMTIAAVICICVLAPCCRFRKNRRNKGHKAFNVNNMYHQRILPPNQFHNIHQTMLKNRPQQDDDEHHYQTPMIVEEYGDHRYETPWDRKFRSVQYWSNAGVAAPPKNEMAMTSPVESSIGLGSSISDRTVAGTSNGSLPHYNLGPSVMGTSHGVINADGTIRIPTNFTSAASPTCNSNNTRHDDSGLESV